MRPSIVHRGSPALTAILSLFLISAFVPRARAQELADNNARPDARAALLAPPAPAETKADAGNFRPNAAAVPRKMSRAQRRAWYLLGVAQHGAAFFDARTTRAAMSHYQELDPLLRPFARSAALYPVMQIAPLGLDWLATRLATSRHKWIRRIWWVPQAAATAGFLWSGAHNLGLSSTGGVPSAPGAP